MVWNHQELKELEKYTSYDLAQKLRGVLEKQARGDQILIGNTGMVSSGKSSLFNALLGAVEEERFKTGAIPTTKTGDQAQLTPTVRLVDTPGIDVDETDDETAYQNLMACDLIVMVHNVKTGPLTKRESDWLKKIASGMQPDQVRQRLIFVCSWIEERENSPGYKELLENLRQQVPDAVGAELPFWEVSAKRYKTGRLKQKDRLVELSGIPSFKDFLLKRAEEYRKKLAYRRDQEQLELITEIKDLLSIQKGKALTERQAVWLASQEQKTRTLEKWNRCLRPFHEKREKIKEMQGER